MIIQVHSEDKRGYINEHKEFAGENNISSEDNRYLDDYVMELVSRRETDKVVIRKFEELLDGKDIKTNNRKRNQETRKK